MSASCSKCGQNVGCSCKLKGGLCAKCKAEAEKAKANANTTNPPQG